MSLGCDEVNRSTKHFALLAALAALTGEAAALGLGELRGAPALGERPRMEVDILGGDRLATDPGCYQLRRPSSNSGLPWLKEGTLSVRSGKPPVLVIRSHLPINDPLFEVAIHISCGYDMTREFVVAVSPPSSSALKAPSELPKAAPAPAPAVRRAAAPVQPAAKMTPPPPATGLAAEAKAPAAADAGKPVGMVPAEGAAAADDKIKSMEAKVGELQQRAAELTQKIEQTGMQGQVPAEAKPAEPAAAPVPAPAPAPAAPSPAIDKGTTNWPLYSALIGAVLLIAGWLSWRGRKDKESAGADIAPAIVVDPRRRGEREEQGGGALDVEPAKMAMPLKLDIQQQPVKAPVRPQDSMMSIAAASVDEHFESNPVMELAEIMLSFGRVKGAAQALQEYIDANPQEAVKPWMRLLEVYRMGGMKAEFEKVAGELNKHFNVQVTPWDEGTTGSAAGVDVVLDAGKPAGEGVVAGVEGMPHVVGEIVGRWESGGVVDYMDRLLRDNRGGTRNGFPLPVVADLLFLIELKEYSNQLDREAKS